MDTNITHNQQFFQFLEKFFVNRAEVSKEGIQAGTETCTSFLKTAVIFFLNGFFCLRPFCFKNFRIIFFYSL
ncbi:Uncharacterised protein [Mycobacterium tuberculosis]|nr:Uncharacterised protein [Mycobacterium tuberculosis]